MLKPKWTPEAVKAYESGQGVKLVSMPHPHYEPLPEDLNPESLETVEIELPESTFVGLTDEEARKTFEEHNCTISAHLAGILARAIEAKLKEKTHENQARN